MTGEFRERVVRMGPGQSLAGILTLPREPRSGVPHVVLVNAGIVHRVGPNRLYVELARAVATLGYPVLRFDLSGLGDSDVVSHDGSLADSALADIRCAVDFLATSRKAGAFLVGGLCSGANHSLLATFDDERVVGTLLIDPTTVRTRRSKVVHLGRRLRNLATWRSLLTLRHPAFRRSLVRLRGSVVVHAATGQSEQRARLDGGPMPKQARVRESIERVIARGAELMFVFTGGVNHVYNYREQLFDLLPGLDFRDQLRLLYMPETDHTVSDVESRQRFLAAVGEWIVEAFPAVEAAAVIA